MAHTRRQKIHCVHRPSAAGTEHRNILLASEHASVPRDFQTLYNGKPGATFLCAYELQELQQREGPLKLLVFRTTVI